VSEPSELPPDMIPAEKIAALGRRRGPAAPAEAVERLDPETAARRDRLTSKLTFMQADLGGLFYEMAIRDAIDLDLLLRKAAELQRVDAELGQLERALRLEREGAAGACEHCGALYARSSSFCSSCGSPLRAEAG
jgi:hypothetical protein